MNAKVVLNCLIDFQQASFVKGYWQHSSSLEAGGRQWQELGPGGRARAMEPRDIEEGE